MPRPLLTFTPEMFAAATERRKTVTRRLAGPADHQNKPPYGPQGSTVPIATTWSISKEFDTQRPKDCFTGRVVEKGIFWHLPGIQKPDWAGKTRQARFIPRSLYHLCPLVKLGESTIEHLLDITTEDAIAEGVDGESGLLGTDCMILTRYIRRLGLGLKDSKARARYALLWDTINGDRAPADTNPLCWRIPFSIHLAR